MTLAFNKFNQFAEDIGKGVHIFGTHALKIALTNSAPVATNTVLANITEISYTNCSTRAVTTSSYTQTAGVAPLICADLTLSATGTVGPFRYIVLYNDTPTSPADPLIGWWDRGAALTLENGDVELLDFDSTNGVWKLTTS